MNKLVICFIIFIFSCHRVLCQEEEEEPRFDYNGPNRLFGYPNRPILNRAGDRRILSPYNPENIFLFLRNPIPNLAVGLNQYVSSKLSFKS